MNGQTDTYVSAIHPSVPHSFWALPGLQEKPKERERNSNFVNHTIIYITGGVSSVLECK